MPEPKRGNRWGKGSEPSPRWEGVLLGLVHRVEGPEKVPHLMDGSRGMGGEVGWGEAWGRIEKESEGGAKREDFYQKGRAVMHEGRATLGQVSLNNKKKMAVKIGRDEHRQMTGRDLKYHVSESLQSRHF